MNRSQNNSPRVVGSKFVYISCLLVVLGTSCLYAQDKAVYRTRQLEKIGRMLETRGIESTVPGIRDASAICSGKSIQVETGFGGLVSRIHFVLFDTLVMTEYPHPVYYFAERYLLQLVLMDDRAGIVRLLGDNKVQLWLNEQPFEKSPLSVASFVSAIQPDRDFFFTVDSAGYRVGWKTRVGTLQMAFPKQYELIIGKDKIEVEDDFQKELFLFLPDAPLAESISPAELELVQGSGYYRREGVQYMIPGLNTDRYYHVSADGSVSLFFDKNNPEVTLANLFLDGDRIDQEVMMSAEHRRYGKRRDQLEVSVRQFVAFCKSEKCVPYFGVEESDKEKIAGTVIMVNSDLGYNHVLYYACDRQKFIQGDLALKVWLYTYVPTHNIQNLFEEYKPKAKKINY